MLVGPRGTTERIRTSAVDLRRIAFHPWNGGKYRCVATPAAVAMAAPSLSGVLSRASEVGNDRKDRRVEQTTSTPPASSRSAALNPFDVPPATTSLAGVPRASRVLLCLPRQHVACAGPVSASTSGHHRTEEAVWRCLSGTVLVHRHRHRPVLRLSEIARSPCAGRTSGVDASAFGAGAPVAAEHATAVTVSSRETSCCDVGCRTRNVEGPPGLPGRPFSTSDGESLRQKGPPQLPATHPTGRTLGRRNRRDGVPAASLASGRGLCG